MSLSTVTHQSATLPLAAPGYFALHSTGSHQRARLQQFIAERYQQAYSARITHFLPLLMSFEKASTALAALGLNSADNGPLFLETYLDTPIQQAIAERAQMPVERKRIIEIGNLVSLKPGSSRMLFLVMCSAVYQAGFHWMAFTATEQVSGLLKHLDYHPLLLNDANPERLGSAVAQWGSYYATQPKVLAGNIKTAMEIVAAKPALLTALIPYQQQIDQLAMQLRQQLRTLN